MKTIYCVMHDWAFNGGSEQGTLGEYAKQLGVNWRTLIS